MEPEISHRCSSCGASYRAGAQFCPQCGAVLGKAVVDEPPKPGQLAVTAQLKGSKRRSKKKRRGSKSDSRALPFAATQASENPVSPVEIPVVQLENQTRPLAADGHHVNPPIIEPAADGGHTKRQRVKDAARGMVEDNVRPRVEKLRHVSSFVLEEAAAIDPSLRFVLIALFLFVVFIVLLLVSFIR